MTERSQEKRPEEIEDEIARTRADMDVTLDAIQRKLSPGELIDRAFSYVKQNGGGEMMTGVGNLVRDNPVPVALIGVGLAWLMYSAARPRELGDERYDHGPQAGLGQGAYGTAYASADEANGGTSGTASRAASAVSGAASSAADRARSLAASAGERLGGTFDTVTGRGRHLGAYARDGWERTRHSYDSIASDRPLVLGAIGLAAGAAVGLMLPSTHSEDEMLGEYRDQLFEQAQAAGREQVQKAQTVANETWRAARDTAKEAAAKQGFAPTASPAEERTTASASRADRPNGDGAKPVV